MAISTGSGDIPVSYTLSGENLLKRSAAPRIGQKQAHYQAYFKGNPKAGDKPCRFRGRIANQSDYRKNQRGYARLFSPFPGFIVRGAPSHLTGRSIFGIMFALLLSDDENAGNERKAP